MLNIDDIKAVNIEISSKCNANCAFCSRNQKVRPFNAQLLTFEDFKKLPSSFMQQLRRLSFGGNFGDLCCNPELVEIAAYIRRLNPGIRLEGDTNGSLQDEAWWRALGASFEEGGMVFALDGLEDTHRHYRRGTQFGKIMRNLQAFIAGGGNAFWKFIVFEHNEHQVDEAEKRARAIGCKHFLAVVSRDFNDSYRPPQNLALKAKREIYSDQSESLSENERFAICRPHANHSIYIAADGSVHPCCLAHCMYITEHNQQFDFIVPLIEKYRDGINFKTTPLADILGGPYFKAVLAQSRDNPYCINKCNAQRRRVRRKLIVRDRAFA